MAIDYHPGGTFYRIGRGAARYLLGEVGPHHRLPGMRFAELLGLAGAATASSLRNHSLIAMLPLAWPDQDLSPDDAAAAVAVALAGSGLVAEADATGIARGWSAAFGHRRLPIWESDAVGPVCLDDHSTRHASSEDRDVLNALLASAAGATPADVGRHR
jgi:hypothetical protein